MHEQLSEWPFPPLLDLHVPEKKMTYDIGMDCKRTLGRMGLDIPRYRGVGQGSLAPKPIGVPNETRIKSNRRRSIGQIRFTRSQALLFGVALFNPFQTGKPDQNAYIDRFDPDLWRGGLSDYLFDSLDEAREITAEWLEQYNEIRPHDALGRCHQRAIASTCSLPKFQLELS